MQDGSPSSSPQTLPFSAPPYLLSIDDVAAQLSTDPESGLSDSEVKSRQLQYGPNAVIHLCTIVHQTDIYSCKEEEVLVGQRFY